MKRIALCLIALCFLSASCNKDNNNEWSRFYGFTQTDIVGHYEANPDESLYEELPTEGVVVYDHASIDIGAVGNVSISLHIVIPGQINKSFSGAIDMNDEQRSDIVLTNVINNTNKEDVMMTVYKNDEGQVRFHGRVKRYHYSSQPGHENEFTSENWGFDVIKEE